MSAKLQKCAKRRRRRFSCIGNYWMRIIVPGYFSLSYSECLRKASSASKGEEGVFAWVCVDCVTEEVTLILE